MVTFPCNCDAVKMNYLLFQLYSFRNNLFMKKTETKKTKRQRHNNYGWKTRVNKRGQQLMIPECTESFFIVDVGRTESSYHCSLGVAACKHQHNQLNRLTRLTNRMSSSSLSSQIQDFIFLSVLL